MASRTAERYHYYDIAPGDDGRMYLSGEAGIIYRSDNRGRRWQRLALDYDGSLFGVIALEGDSVICFGLRGNIFRSDDAGANWYPVSPEPESRHLVFTAAQSWTTASSSWWVQVASWLVAAIKATLLPASRLTVPAAVSARPHRWSGICLLGSRYERS